MKLRLLAKEPLPEPDHRSVAVSVGIHPCEAALRRRGHRYLSREAPFLPLPKCTDVEACDCIYLHYDDRRHQSERRLEPVEANPASLSARKGLDRRKSARSRAVVVDPQIQDLKNSVHYLKCVVEGLAQGDPSIKLDQLYDSLDNLREEVEYRVLLDYVTYEK